MVFSSFNSINGGFKTKNMNSNQINMMSNNANGIQPTKKRIKIIQYFKIKLLPQGILFLQETHFTEYNEASWRDEFDATLFSLPWIV